MYRSPAKLHQAARACRAMAAECATNEARKALLEVADSLDGEAAAKEQSIERLVQPAPMFNWMK